MKPIRTMLFVTAFMFGITACEKQEDFTETLTSEEVSASLSTDDAAEIFAAALGSESAGVSQQAEDALQKALEIIAQTAKYVDIQASVKSGDGNGNNGGNEDINGNGNGDRDQDQNQDGDQDRDQDRDMNQDQDGDCDSSGNGNGNGYTSGCDTTITGTCDSTNNDYTWDYSWDHDYFYNWDGDSLPDSIYCNFNHYGYIDAPRYQLQDTCYGQWQLNGISPDSAAFNMNGYCYRSGQHQFKNQNQNRYNVRISQTLNGVKIDKTSKDITCGNATMQLMAMTMSGYSYSFTAQVRFAGNGIAALTIGNTVYTINLNSASIEE